MAWQPPPVALVNVHGRSSEVTTSWQAREESLKSLHKELAIHRHKEHELQSELRSQKEAVGLSEAQAGQLVRELAGLRERVQQEQEEKEGLSTMMKTLADKCEREKKATEEASFTLGWVGPPHGSGIGRDGMDTT